MSEVLDLIAEALSDYIGPDAVKQEGDSLTLETSFGDFTVHADEVLVFF